MSEDQTENSEQMPKFNIDEKILSQIDPGLQNIIIKLQNMQQLAASEATTAPTGEIWIDVEGELYDPDVDVPGLEILFNISKIFAGRLQVQDIEKVFRNKNVRSLKASQAIGPAKS